MKNEFFNIKPKLLKEPPQSPSSPFLFVEKLVGAYIDHKEKKYWIVAEQELPKNSYYFAGHFPDNPMLPGSLMIEALSQLSGLLIYNCLSKKFLKHNIYLVNINNTWIRKKVKPGVLLKMNAEVIKKGKMFWTTKGKILVKGKLVCEAELMLIVIKEKNEKR